MPPKKQISKNEKSKNIDKKENVKTIEESYTDDDIDEFSDDEIIEDYDFFDSDKFKDFGYKNTHNSTESINNPEIHKEIIIVPDNKRLTSEVITKFEFTEVVSIRAKQIENGSKVFSDTGNLSCPIKMAELEIKNKQCPLSIKRMIDNHRAEIWAVNDMVIPYI